MDERLAAGRHHLGNGEKALQQRYLDEGRSHFESALLQFRGPDLRIGEAHALRGLARVELGIGQLARAEERVREATTVYQDVKAQLRRLDSTGASSELQRDAEVGEASALVLLSEILGRVGKRDDAREALSYARQIFDENSDAPESAGVWTASARFYMREGNYDVAQDAFNRALSIHEAAGDLAGQAEVLLGLAELRRLEENLKGAEEHLRRARPVAQQARAPALECRAVCQLGALFVQQLRLDEAREAFDDGLPLARQAADTELEAFAMLGLGDVESRRGSASATDHLVDAARLFASLRHTHGLGNALLRMAQHAVRVDEPEVGLLAAESARRLWKLTDPLRGVGQTLRIVVKTLRPMKEWTVLLHAVYARAAIAGHLQPNALAVRDFYSERSPEAVIAELEGLTKSQLVERFEGLVGEVVRPMLSPYDLNPVQLGTIKGALTLVEALAARLPTAPEDEPSDESEDSEEYPPEEESLHATGYEAMLREAKATEGFESKDADSVPKEQLSAPIPSERPPPARAEGPEPTRVSNDDDGPYAGLYEPPPEVDEDDVTVDESADDGSDGNDHADPATEEEEDVKKLQSESPPDGYEYAAPTEVDEDDAADDG